MILLIDDSRHTLNEGPLVKIAVTSYRLVVLGFFVRFNKFERFRLYSFTNECDPLTSASSPNYTFSYLACIFNSTLRISYLFNNKPKLEPLSIRYKEERPKES